MMTLVKFSKYPWCSCILRLQQTSAISTSTTVNMKKLPKSEKYAMIRRGQKTKWQKFLRKCDGFPTSAQAQWFQMAYALSFYGSKIVLDRPNHFGRVPIVLGGSN